MIIDLINLPRTPFAFEFALKPEEADLQGEDVRFRGDVLVKGEVEKVDGRYVVRGTIESDQSLDCSRCLEPIETNSNIGFDVGYVPAETQTGEVEHELRIEDLDIAVLYGDQLDLNEVAREQILLSLPEQIFCKDDCKGLCQKCGGNRNLIDCNCDEHEIDPRWSALKKLK